jgi:hypothetical protein
MKGCSTTVQVLHKRFLDFSQRLVPLTDIEKNKETANPCTEAAGSLLATMP